MIFTSQNTLLRLRCADTGREDQPLELSVGAPKMNFFAEMCRIYLTKINQFLASMLYIVNEEISCQKKKKLRHFSKRFSSHLLQIKQ